VNFNLPTKLTFFRILLIPVFIAAFFLPFWFASFIALGIFLIACATDFLDGYFARKLNQITDLGKFLDPIADKMLVTSAMCLVLLYQPIFAPYQAIAAVLVVIIICRELLVSCFRIMAAQKNVALAADNLGKFKTTFQMLALFVLIPFPAIRYLTRPWTAGFYISMFQSSADSAFFVGLVLLFVATILTIISGANYIIKNRNILSTKSQTATEKDQTQLNDNAKND